MKMYNYKILTGILCFTLLSIIGCKKMDSTYSEFLEGGEKIYTSKADSLLVRPGNERVMLSWLLISDPKVNRYKIFWNSRKDSLEGTLKKTAEVDSIHVLIPNLKEGVYNFEVFQYDNLGNSSVKVEAIGKSYGKQYLNSLLNRAFNTIQRNGSNLEIEWMPSEESVKEIQLEYTDNKGVKKNEIIPAAEVLTVLENFPYGGTFNYKTIYLPEPLSLDVFSAALVSETEKLEEMNISKANWKNYPLPGDTYQSEYSDWKIENLWDGFTDVSPKFFYVDPNLPDLKLPNWFTLDLGSKFKLTKFRMYQLAHAEAWMYNYGAPKTFEVYASQVPASDGSWTGWDLLGSFSSVKPSGLPQGDLSAEDVARARAGEEFELKPTDKAYQYIRVKITSTWGGNLNPMISELSLRGFYAID